ncbi:hypothetical protein HAX54_019065, partial [Datura stramonium]|nr:hypothetical protein [Datura stramonium]
SDGKGKSPISPLKYVIVASPRSENEKVKRYGELLWDYGRRKQDDGAISKNEVSGNAMSKFGGPKVSRQPVPDYNKKRWNTKK